jgi:TP901-1 family phage major tail protein
MAKYCGKIFILSKGNEDGPPETFTLVGGIKTTGMTINKEQVDITTKDDSDFRQLLADCGLKSMSISAAGLFSDEAKINEMQAEVLTGAHKMYKITSARGDSFTGLFELSTFERNGDKVGAEQYTTTLESAGDIDYTPAP